jgi:MFS family permease
LTGDRLDSGVLTGSGLLVTALGLCALATNHGLAGRLVGLALAGAGLGAFMPANNAGVMAAVSRARAGALSGVLNTARGIGTALGVALASLIYTAVARPAGVLPTGGAGATLAAAGRGLSVTLIVLAAVALGTAALLLATGARTADR